jgi:hypothetical protein
MAELSGSSTIPEIQAAPSGSGDLGGVVSSGTDRIRGPRDGAWPLFALSPGSGRRRRPLRGFEGARWSSGLWDAGQAWASCSPDTDGRQDCSGCLSFPVHAGTGDSGDSGGSDPSRCRENCASHAKAIEIVMQGHRVLERPGNRTSRTSRTAGGDELLGFSSVVIICRQFGAAAAIGVPVRGVERLGQSSSPEAGGPPPAIGRSLPTSGRPSLLTLVSGWIGPRRSLARPKDLGISAALVGRRSPVEDSAARLADDHARPGTLAAPGPAVASDR